MICAPLWKMFLAPLPLIFKVGLFAVFLLANFILTFNPFANVGVPAVIFAVFAAVAAAVLHSP